MKKIFSILLSFSIIFSSLSTASAIELELPKSLEQFTEDVSTLINEYDGVTSSDTPVFFTADDESETADINDTNRLIVKSSRNIDTLNSINCVSGYNDLYILQFADDEGCDEAFEYYSSLSCVEYVQEDGILTETVVEESEATINEAAIGTASQYQSDLFGYTNAKANMGSEEVTIAVVDTGVQNDHEYLKGRVIPTGFDSVYNESCYDKRGHGTHVAGIIAANTKSNVKIKPYKVIGDDGTGTDTQLYLGIQAAIEDGVDVINLSLTRKGESEVVHEAVQNAYNAGITVVAAAGNDNVNLNENFYTPACFDEVICVVSIDTNKKRASTSNWRFEDTLSAPGVDILSSYINNTYKIMSGTSMATPFISCCVAYLLATGGNYSPEEVYNTLYNNTQQGATANIHYVVPGELITAKNTCATPAFEYASGEFAGFLIVKITCDTPGATIMYRTSDMNSKTYYEYTGPVRIEKNTSFTAYAFCRNYKNSSTVSANYTKINMDTSAFEVDENGILVGYNGNETDIEIPSFVNGYGVAGVSASAFAGNTSVTSVTFGQYLKTIGEGAFKGCTALTDIYASGCTDIESEAFSGCSSLTNVSAPSVITLGDRAFSGCSALNKLTLGKLTTLGERVFESTGITTFSAANLVTIGDYAFSGTPIKSATFANVKTIGSNAFSNCKSLTSASFTKATLIGNNCFAGCDNLTTASFSALTVIPSNLLKNCLSLTSVFFSVATEVGDYAFYGCSALTAIEVPEINSVGDYAFYGCTGVTSFDFTNITSIGDYAFSKTGLENLVLPNVTELGEKAFYDCTGVETIELPVATTFDTIGFLGLSNVQSLVLPKVTEFTFNGGSFSNTFPNLRVFNNASGLTSIPSGMFDGCSKLSTVTFNKVTSIDSDVFKGTALEEVIFNSVTTLGAGCFSNIPTLETVELNGVTSIDFSVFSGSKKIKTLSLAGITELPDDFNGFELFPELVTFNAPLVTEIPQNAFKNCGYLTSCSFKNILTIGDEAFCGTLINNPDCQKLTSIGTGAFKNCTNLGVVKLPLLENIDLNVFENSEASVTQLDLRGVNNITENGAQAFSFLKFNKLVSINLNALSVIPASAFAECHALKEVIINNCTKICEEAFAYCTSLISIKVNKATEIEKNAFLNCESLQNFEADSVTTFDFSTFEGCLSLLTLSFDSLTQFPVDSEGRFNISGVDNLQSFSADKLMKIPDNFLKNCQNLTSVSFAAATEVGAYAFYDTALSNYTFSAVEKIGDYAFYGTNITAVIMQTVTSVGEYAFAECKKLKSFNIPVRTLPVNALSGSSALTSISIDVTELPVEDDGSTYVSDKPSLISFTAEDVETIPEMYFMNNPLLQNAVIYATYIGDRAFCGTDLREMYADNLVTVGDYAFYGTEISEAELYCATEIGDFAFANCSYLNTFVIYNEYEENEKLVLGKGVCANDTALARTAIYGEDIELPEYFFKNCTKLKMLYATDYFKANSRAKLADLKSVGKEALYGCSAMQFDDIKISDIENIGVNAFVGLSNSLTPKDLNLQNLKSADTGAFGDLKCRGLSLENAEIIKNIPECEYVVIGSDIKEFTCEATDSIICAYEGSVVDEFCTANGLNFKKYDGKENIFIDVDPLLTGYDYVLSFEGIGFNTTYEWYACNNPDRSDAVLIETTLEDPQTIDPIAIFFDDYEENKYTYFYCVATSTENGNVLKTQSRLCKNIFATIKGTDDTFIDFWEGGIFTHSLNNINTLDNILVVDGDIRVTPSYSTDTETCYGSGTVVEILNGDEVALTQRIVVYGDINGDGVVDALDVSRIEKESNGNSVDFSEYALQAAADIDKSGIVDELDYQAAVNKALAS